MSFILLWDTRNTPSCPCFSIRLGLPGGEAQADRAHAEREEDSSGGQLSFPGAARVLLQGKNMCGDWVDFPYCTLLFIFNFFGGGANNSLIIKNNNQKKHQGLQL